LKTLEVLSLKEDGNLMIVSFHIKQATYKKR